MKKDYNYELWKKLNALVARVNYGGNYVSYFGVVSVPAGYAYLMQLCEEAEAAGMEEDEVLPYVLRGMRQKAHTLGYCRSEAYAMEWKHRVEVRLHPERYDANGRRIRLRRAH